MSVKIYFVKVYFLLISLVSYFVDCYSRSEICSLDSHFHVFRLQLKDAPASFKIVLKICWQKFQEVKKN